MTAQRIDKADQYMDEFGRWLRDRGAAPTRLGASDYFAELLQISHRTDSTATVDIYFMNAAVDAGNHSADDIGGVRYASWMALAQSVESLDSRHERTQSMNVDARLPNGWYCNGPAGRR